MMRARLNTSGMGNLTGACRGPDARQRRPEPARFAPRSSGHRFRSWRHLPWREGLAGTRAKPSRPAGLKRIPRSPDEEGVRRRPVRTDWRCGLHPPTGLGRLRRVDTPPTSPSRKACPVPCMRNSASRRGWPGIAAFEYLARRCQFDRCEIVARGRGANGRPGNQAVLAAWSAQRNEWLCLLALQAASVGAGTDPAAESGRAWPHRFGRFVTRRTKSEIGGLTSCNEGRN